MLEQLRELGAAQIISRKTRMEADDDKWMSWKEPQDALLATLAEGEGDE